MIVQNSHRNSAPTLPAILQTTRIRRRVQTSESVAALLAELAFGPPRESLSWLTPASSIAGASHG